MNFLTKIAAVEMNISTVITKETTDADLQAAKKHFFNIEHHLKNNTSHNSLRYAMKYDLIKIDLNKLTDRQKIGLTNYLLAELSIEQGKTAEATDYYTSYLAFADNIIADDAGRNLFYNTHLNLALIDLANKDYENTIFQLRQIDNHYTELELLAEEELYYKLILAFSLHSIDQNEEATNILNNILQVNTLYFNLYKDLFNKNKSANIEVTGIGKADINLMNDFLNNQNIQIITFNKDTRNNICNNFIKTIIEQDKEFKPIFESIISAHDNNYNLETVRFSFVLTSLLSSGCFYNKLIAKKTALISATRCPSPKNIDEALCKASGYISNEHYEKAADIILPFIKTQKDAIKIFNTVYIRGEIYEDEFSSENKTLQEHFESNNIEYLLHFHHDIKFAKYLLKRADFKYPEICYYNLGAFYKTNYWMTPKENKNYIKLSIKYFEMAQNSKKLPKSLHEDIKLGLSKFMLKN